MLVSPEDLVQCILDILRRKSLQNAGEETAFNDDYKENQIFTHVVFKE